jgi:hypothetical protein
MSNKETLADRLEAFARDASKLHGSAREHVIRTLGGCANRNIGEIVAALREREARFALSNDDGTQPARTQVVA